MLKIEKDRKKLISFRQLKPAPLPPSDDLRQLISNSGAEFFGEFGEELFVLQGVAWPTEAAQVAADIVAIDKHGRSVAVILPRAQEESQLARAIASVGILSRWKPDDFLKAFPKEEKDARESIASFVGGDPRGINAQQRAILLADHFDVTILTATKWLRDQTGLDIACVRLSLGVDAADTEFLSCADVSATSLPVDTLLQPAAPEVREPVKSERRPLPGGVDRRRQLRTLKYDTQHLKLGNGNNEVLVTHLIDLSERGLGAETRDPLSVGAYVTVAGDLHGSESAVKLEGRARVAHCRRHNGGFRVGLSFEEIRCQDLY